MPTPCPLQPSPSLALPELSLSYRSDTGTGDHAFLMGNLKLEKSSSTEHGPEGLKQGANVFVVSAASSFHSLCSSPPIKKTHLKNKNRNS